MLGTIGKLLGACTVGLGLMACGSSHPLLAERIQTEAGHLQGFCKRSSLVDVHTLKADSLLSASSRHLKDGDEESALAEAELASTLYRLSLAHRDLNEANTAVEGLKVTLAKDKDQLQTYQQILEEMKTVRKP
jgi:hypothetical protein